MVKSLVEPGIFSNDFSGPFSAVALFNGLLKPWEDVWETPWYSMKKQRRKPIVFCTTYLVAHPT